ncbi:helix-turn-helix transcriptional regulator [Deferribacterales bacterium RsTz2092]|nr:transcriptional regulator [Deferribacterales bacterium]
MKRTSILPLPVRKALRKLGSDIKEARIRRRLTMGLVAERAGITAVSLSRVERGDGAVSIAIYGKVLFVLGLTDNLYNLADTANDTLGQVLASEQLPKRVRYKKRATNG